MMLSVFVCFEFLASSSLLIRREGEQETIYMMDSTKSMSVTWNSNGSLHDYLHPFASSLVTKNIHSRKSLEGGKYLRPRK